MLKLSALFSGLLFGFGLIISGMANPAKVTAFLDLAGHWDPSLAFVMMGAIMVAFFVFRWAAKRNHSLVGQPLQHPTLKQVDRRLVIGSALFGIGWGLAGICPGPALVLLASGLTKAIVFVIAMLSGMAVYRFLFR